MLSPELPAHWLMDHRLQDRLLHALWSAGQPRTPAQFYLWSQARLQPLLPHQWLACAAQAPGSPRLSARLFHVKPLPAPVQDLLQTPEHGLWQWLLNRWLPEARALRLSLASDVPAALALPLLEAGQVQLLVHGLPLGPQRADSLFVLGRGQEGATGLAEGAGEGVGGVGRGGDRGGGDDDLLRRLELLVPALHAAWRRVLLQQQDLERSTRAAPLVTPRELQIVQGLRAGLSNEGIARQLGISMFTVKNHVRKILRKLGASNRAQAVAIALEALERRPGEAA